DVSSSEHTPVNPGPIHEPASTNDSSSAVSSTTGPFRFVVRSRSGSWRMTGTPSALVEVSTSMKSTSSARAASTAARLFSGTTAESPRWAITNGRFADPGRSVNPRSCRNCRKLIGPDYALTQQLSHAEARVVLDYREVGRKPPQTPDLVLPCQHGHLPDSKGPLMEAICAAA